MPRLVADTNIVVSALLWHGAPHRLFESIDRGALDFFTSRALLDELAEVLKRRKLQRAVQATEKSVEHLVREYQEVARVVKPRRLRRGASRDPDDDAVLACALAARADFIVTGDKDLLSLGTYRKIPILRAADAVVTIALRSAT